MKASAAAVAIAVILSGSAFAQDDVTIPDDLPLFTWTGFYVGAHGGAAFSDAEFDEVNDALFPPFVLNGIPILLIPGRFGTIPETSVSDLGASGGGQAGFNWQAGRFVFGAEADISGTGVDRKTDFAVIPFAPGFGAGQILTGTYSFDADWIASLNGKVGISFDRVLVYATGGVAHVSADVRSSFTLVNTNPGVLLPAVGSSGTTTESDSFNEFGVTFGGGVEWALNDRWSIAGDVRHSEFGSKRVNLGSTDPSDLALLPPVSTDVDLSLSEASLRVNYRFGAAR